MENTFDGKPPLTSSSEVHTTPYKNRNDYIRFRGAPFLRWHTCTPQCPKTCPLIDIRPWCSHCPLPSLSSRVWCSRGPRGLCGFRRVDRTNSASDMEYDNFLHYTSRLLMADVLGDVYVDFSKLDSPNSRFMFTRALLRKHKLQTRTLKVDMDYDSPSVSTGLRLDGNKFFKAKQYAKAAELYTECLMGSDPNAECHALALANRSAAYFHMGKYELSLKDAHWAMGSNYPTKLMYKLYERAGHAERMIGLIERAIQSYATCLTLVGEVDMPEENKRKFRAAIEKVSTECAEVLAVHKMKPKKPQLDEQLIGGRNERIPALSSFVELRMSKDTGRGVYATRDINPGDVVAIDEPYICGPITDNVEVCHYNGCLKLGVALYPCPKCLLVYYCNKDCMNKAKEEGHYLECPIIYFIRSTPGITRINELAMKWFLKDYLKLGLKKYCSIVDGFSKSKIDPQTRGFDETGQYKSDNFLTAYSLDSNENKLSIDVLFFFNCIAVDMLHYLVLSGIQIPECYIGTVGASLVQILIVLDLNCRKLNINAPTLSLQGKNQLTLTVALTLYPTIFLFNHSCDPNIKRSGELSGRIRVMKAIQPIPKGTQLCGTYGMIFRGHSKESRQEFCNQNFNFECCCQPCMKNWPTCYYIPNRLSTLNILDPDMAEIVSSECQKFVEFTKSVKTEDSRQHLNKHLNYLYSFIKLLFNNVKRPFELYEDCLEMISMAHTMSSIEMYIGERTINIE